MKIEKIIYAVVENLLFATHIDRRVVTVSAYHILQNARRPE